MSEKEAAVIAEQISIMRAEMGGGSAPYLHSPLGDVCDFYTYLEDEHGIRRKVIPFEHAEENAARIMALWNATLGIPTADLSALSASRERERALRRALEKAFLWSMVGKPDHRENFLSYINWSNDINFVQTAIGTGRSWKDAFGDELEIAEKAKRDYEAALAKTGGV